jgi:hypothetical protein
MWVDGCRSSGTSVTSRWPIDNPIPRGKHRCVHTALPHPPIRAVAMHIEEKTSDSYICIATVGVLVVIDYIAARYLSLCVGLQSNKESHGCCVRHVCPSLNAPMDPVSLHTTHSAGVLANMAIRIQSGVASWLHTGHACRHHGHIGTSLSPNMATHFV